MCYTRIYERLIHFMKYACQYICTYIYVNKIIFIIYLNKQNKAGGTENENQNLEKRIRKV